MKNKQDTAVELFNSGFNCSQSVLSVFCEKYELSRESALRIACGLGGGVRSGEICGAASGAVLVIGLKYGHYIAEDAESKSICYSKTVEFLSAFRAKNGSFVCREILGCDISTKDGFEKAKNENLVKTICIDMVRSAVSILEELGY